MSGIRGILSEGKWLEKEQESSSDGNFKRSKSVFRDLISKDHERFKPETNRYHLYVSLACPWAHRTLITLKLKGLENVIGVSIVGAEKPSGDWEFSDEPGAVTDIVNNKKFLREIYLKADTNYSGRVTVPVLWDKKHNTIVNNESREVVQILSRRFNELAKKDINLYPINLSKQIETTIDKIYKPINNGVYMCGFAQKQLVYDEAIEKLFEALTYWDNILAKQKFLCGDSLTEADICMFPTLLRFDPVYYTLFKCNKKHLYEFENLWRYVKELYKIPAIKQTCNMDHIKRHYYKYLTSINPYQIVPAGPEIKEFID